MIWLGLTTTYIVCPEHGDLWRQFNAGPGAAIRSVDSEACQDWLDDPTPSMAIKCPRCPRTITDGLLVEHRQGELRVAS